MKQQVKQKTFRYCGEDYPYELHIGGVKRLNLRIRSDGSIRLSVPRMTSQRQIDNFLLRSGPKIVDTIGKIKKTKKPPKTAMSAFEQAQKHDILLTMIRICHQNIVLPRMLSLDLTDEQRRFVTSPAAIRIHPMKTRWGSCNFKKGTLNFNLYLVDQPQECIEYVVMHEFAHFVHPNHSAAYHALMTELMPDWKERKKRLNS